MKNKEKEVVLDETKKNEKEGGKLFTKKKSNNTIKKNYNPLKVNYKIYERGSGLYMKNHEFNIVKRLSKKYNKKECLVYEMLKKCRYAGCTKKETKALIEEFEEKSNCY